MAILFPLCLVGLGACVYYLFAAATLALPILVGAAVGMASHAVGCGTPLSFLCGLAAFMLVIALGRFAALTLRSKLGRGMLMLPFTFSASVAGFFVTSTVARFVGITSGIVLFSLSGALLCAAIAVGRLMQRTA